MKPFRIEFTDNAKIDIAKSFEWGCDEWGLSAALRWYRQLKSQTRKLLIHYPLSQPLAPESSEMDSEIRQMMFGRYRVLFEIDGKFVRILHLRGAFVERDDENLGVVK